MSKRIALASKKGLTYHYNTTVDETANVDIRQPSVLLVMPVLLCFSFAEHHSSLDSKFFLWLWPNAHILFFVAICEKECLATLSGHAERMGSAIKTKSICRRTFKLMKWSVIQCQNEFIGKMFFSSSWERTWFFFCTIKSSLLTNRNVLRLMLPGRLDARLKNNIDEASPFLGAVSEAYCSNKNFDVTRTLSTYVTIARYLYRKSILLNELK